MVNFKKLQGVKRIALELLSVLLPLLLYSLVLKVDIPSGLGTSLQNETPLLLVIATILWLTYRIPGLVGRTTSLSATLILFALLLATHWSTANSFLYTLGGLFPLSDANIYYWNARNLLEGTNLVVVPGADQRPIAIGAFATIIGLTHYNLRQTQTVLVALVAIACFFAGREVQRYHGTLAGVLPVLGVFTFYRTFAGSLMTENIGLALGLLGFAVLWQGTGRSQSRIVYLGLFLLALGIISRPSAFFILPAIILWGAYTFKQSGRFSWRFLILSSAVVLSAFLCSNLLQRIIGSSEITALSNFPYVLYGIVTHTSWDQVLRDYPELANLPPVEKNTKVYELALQAIQDNPFSLVTGILRAWREFFFGKNHSAFFASQPKQFLDFLLGILSFCGLFACVRRWRDAHASLLLACTMGIFVSIPLLPIWDGGLRPYAPVIFIFFLLPALGLSYILRSTFTSLKRVRQIEGIGSVNLVLSNWLQTPSLPNSPALVLVGLLFSVLILAAPISIKLNSHPVNLAKLQSCPTGTDAAYFRFHPGSVLNLVDNQKFQDSHLPNVRVADFKKGYEEFKQLPYFSDYAVSLDKLRKNSTIVDTYNYMWLIAKPNLLPKKPAAIVACGQRTGDPSLPLFRAKSIQIIPNR